MKWFKFYGGEYLSDPKMLSLSACDRSCWLTLLAYASMSSVEGEIKHLTEEVLMIQSGISFQHDEWSMTVGILEKLEKLEMIRIDNKLITIINWEKRQESNLTPYERVKKYREKRKNETNDNAIDNGRLDKNRIDKKKEEGSFLKKTSETEKERSKRKDEAGIPMSHVSSFLKRK